MKIKNKNKIIKISSIIISSAIVLVFASSCGKQINNNINNISATSTDSNNLNTELSTETNSQIINSDNSTETEISQKSETFETSIISETEVKITADGTDWESLYNAILEESKDNVVNYDYVYIDDDDIPELMWTSGNFKVAQTNLYTVKDGKVYYLNTLSTYGSLNYLEKKGIIYVGDSSEGEEKFTIYKLDGATLTIISEGSSNRNTGATGDEQINTVDGKNVTADEFDAAYSAYLNDPSYKTTQGQEYKK